MTKAASKPGTRRSAAQARIERFVSEYLLDFNGTRAATAAGFSAATARVKASQLLAREDVRAQVEAAHEAFLKRSELKKDMVLARLWAIATADPGELTALHRTCCRCCWSPGHRYERTPNEMREHRAKWEAAEAQRQAVGRPAGEFDEEGGEGFKHTRDPNPDCPECCGDGEVTVFFGDTRDLSPAARLLFAGVERTPHGLRVRMHSQMAALLQVGRHLGMFDSRHRVEVGGVGDDPIGVVIREICGTSIQPVDEA